MFCHALFCYALFCHILVCHAVFCHAPCSFLSCFVMLVEGAGDGTLEGFDGPGDLAAAVCNLAGSGGMFFEPDGLNLSGGELHTPGL